MLERLKESFDPTTIGYFIGSDSLYGGLLLGLLLGMLLQKGRLCKYDVVSGMFRMQDFTFFRIGTPLLMTAMILVYLFNDMGIVQLYLPRTIIVAQIVGGVIFGAGLAISGYCPAISAGALGEGALDAIPVMLGIVAGSIVYAEVFNDTTLSKLIEYTDLGRITFPDIFLVFNHWFFIMAFVIMCAMFLVGISLYDEFLKATFFIVDKLTGKKSE